MLSIFNFICITMCVFMFKNEINAYFDGAVKWRFLQTHFMSRSIFLISW